MQSQQREQLAKQLECGIKNSPSVTLPERQREHTCYAQRCVLCNSGTSYGQSAHLQQEQETEFLRPQARGVKLKKAADTRSRRIQQALDAVGVNHTRALLCIYSGRWWTDVGGCLCRVSSHIAGQKVKIIIYHVCDTTGQVLPRTARSEKQRHAVATRKFISCVVEPE